MLRDTIAPLLAAGSVVIVLSSIWLRQGGSEPVLLPESGSTPTLRMKPSLNEDQSPARSDSPRSTAPVSEHPTGAAYLPNEAEAAAMSSIDEALSYAPNEPLWMDLAQAFRELTSSGTKDLQSLHQLKPLLKNEGVTGFNAEQWELVEMENSSGSLVPVLRERKVGSRNERAHIFPDGEIHLMATVDAENDTTEHSQH